MFGANSSNSPAMMGKTWKQDEINKLLASVASKKTIQEIAIEHQRTQGGITSRLKELAANYFINENKSLNEIVTITGLSKEVISDAIAKKEYQNSLKPIKAIKAIKPVKLEPVNINVEELNKKIDLLLEAVNRLEQKVDTLQKKPKMIVKSGYGFV
jgi:hypothetical protein